MKSLLTSATALALGAALAASASAPASAQVSGIGVAEPAVIVAGSQALTAAYSQITTMYAAQRTQLDQLAARDGIHLAQLLAARLRGANGSADAAWRSQSPSPVEATDDEPGGNA